MFASGPGSNRRRPAWEAFRALVGQGFFGGGSRNRITQYDCGSRKGRRRAGADWLPGRESVGSLSLSPARRAMETQHPERRLSAVLAADVAGYSRLVGIDEEGTLARLRSLRMELIDPAIAAHRGRIIKTTGDGILVEFPSVVDAARCALDVQRGLARRNAEIAADRRIAFRIGIHLGDVVVDGADLLGDAVN